MEPKPSVVLIGLIPELVDFTAIPEMNAAKVRALIESEEKRFEEEGFDAHHLLVDLGETAEAVIRAKLAERTFDAVIIGAGVRVPPPYLLLFEKILNVVHEHAPRSRICFNTTPADSLAAVRRWI